jgi:hypothetical protein
MHEAVSVFGQIVRGYTILCCDQPSSTSLNFMKGVNLLGTTLAISLHEMLVYARRPALRMSNAGLGPLSLRGHGAFSRTPFPRRLTMLAAFPV